MYSITIKILLSKSLFIKNAYGGAAQENFQPKN